MRRYGTIFGVLLLMSLVCSTVAGAGEMKRIRWTAQEVGTGIMMYTTSLSEIAKRYLPKDVILDVLPYGAVVASATLVEDGKAEIGWANVTGLWAQQGIILYNRPHKNLTAIGGSFEASSMQVFANKDFVARTGLKINFFERMESLKPDRQGFVVRTSKQEYRTRSVLLTIGRRGTPRKLGVKGESRSKVVYRLVDPEQYCGQHVLVVGGGDSALEAALACADERGTTVTLSYRSEAFSRVKQKNRELVQRAEKARRLKVILSSNVVEIGDGTVTLEQGGMKVVLKNDAVIVCAGGILPTQFLKDTGVQVDTKYGTA